jgi:hypothetical protein
LIVATLITRGGKRKTTITAVELLPSGEVKPTNQLTAEAPILLNAREEALRRAEEDPATAALVVRHWLGTAGSSAEEGASRAA